MTDVHDPTLATLVTTNPEAARVFERHGLDYCCNGNRTLAEACQVAELDRGAIEAELAAISEPADRPANQDPASLARDIVETHHRYLHEELPLLDALAAKVLSVHGERHPELAEVRTLVTAIRADLEPHLLKEERVLFPAIAAAMDGERDFPFGSVANPIRMMMLEHDRAGELLRELRSATDDYTVPPDGCASFTSLYTRLAELEADTHLHIHKENNILFPAVLQVSAGRGDHTG